MKKTREFVGCGVSFENASLVLAGIPYDETSTFRKGADLGPGSMREFSDSIESYSPIHEIDIADMNACDLGDLEFKSGDTEEAMLKIENLAGDMTKNGKKALYIGGEHLISFPIVKRYAAAHKGLSVIYLDAHADLRDDYEGRKLSHSTAARRIGEIIGFENLYMFGIRSFEKAEASFVRGKNIFCRPTLAEFNNIMDKLKNSPVYLSLDLDVFDPSGLPGVGNPEAGGIGFNDFAGILPGIRKLNNLAGADIVELSPSYDTSGISSVFAAKVARELIAAMG